MKNSNERDVVRNM